MANDDATARALAMLRVAERLRARRLSRHMQETEGPDDGTSPNPLIRPQPERRLIGTPCQ